MLDGTMYMLLCKVRTRSTRVSCCKRVITDYYNSNYYNNGATQRKDTHTHTRDDRDRRVQGRHLLFFRAVCVHRSATRAIEYDRRSKRLNGSRIRLCIVFTQRWWSCGHAL